MISYKVENNLDINEFRTVLLNSTLGERRPIDDLERLQKMLEFANLIITARDDGKLVGVSRSITDFGFCTYLSDLAVDKAYQKQGIGKELIKLTKNETPDAVLILLAAPAAETYYPKIGMKQYEQCYFIKDINQII